MVYHVIIDLDDLGKRRVGKVISLLEKMEFEFVEIKKKMALHSGKEFAGIGQFILKSKLKDLEAMNFYHERFVGELDKKIEHLYANNVELFFEKEGKQPNPNELWELIVDKVFDRGRDMPIMFVVTAEDENGFDGSFIPNDFEPEAHEYYNPRTLMPLGK